MVLDLDPGAPAGPVEACVVALLLRAELDRRGLVGHPKASGGKGLHVYVPVVGATYAATKGLARELARILARRHRDLVVDTMTKALRHGRVLVDWSQNDAGKSTVAAWSVRGASRPTVSAPVTWREVEQVVDTADPARLVVGLGEARRRLEEHGDLFAPVLEPTQRLPG